MLRLSSLTPSDILLLDDRLHVAEDTSVLIMLFWPTVEMVQSDGDACTVQDNSVINNSMWMVALLPFMNPHYVETVYKILTQVAKYGPKLDVYQIQFIVQIFQSSFYLLKIKMLVFYHNDMYCEIGLGTLIILKLDTCRPNSPNSEWNCNFSSDIVTDRRM